MIFIWKRIENIVLKAFVCVQRVIYSASINLLLLKEIKIFDWFFMYVCFVISVYHCNARNCDFLHPFKPACEPRRVGK